ncbi:MAG: CsbD family protein [Acidimicrobiaceae bacterium]|nr:CsbD family protein [Acidimicrobiaceae bacterium]
MSGTDKLADKAQSAKGHVKEATGRATGDRSMEMEGRADRTAGNLKQAGEKIKDAVKPQGK